MKLLSDCCKAEVRTVNNNKSSATYWNECTKCGKDCDVHYLIDNSDKPSEQEDWEIFDCACDTCQYKEYDIGDCRLKRMVAIRALKAEWERKAVEKYDEIIHAHFAVGITKEFKEARKEALESFGISEKKEGESDL